MIFTNRESQRTDSGLRLWWMAACFSAVMISAASLSGQSQVRSVGNEEPASLAACCDSELVDQDSGSALNDLPLGNAQATARQDSQNQSDRAGSLNTATTDQLAVMIKAQREAIAADTQLSDEEKTLRLEMLLRAREQINQVRLHETEQAKIAGRLKQYPREIEENSKRLNTAIPSEDPPAAHLVDSETLHRQLIKKRQLLSSKKQELDSHELDSKDHQERITVVPKLRAETNERLKLVNEGIERLENEPSDALHQLSLLLLHAKRKAAQSQASKLDAEVEIQELAGKFFPIQRDLIARRVSQLESEVRKWEAELTAVRKLETMRETEAAKNAASNVDPILRSLADRNKELVALREKMNHDLETLADESSKLQSDIEALQSRFGSLKDKIDAVGLSKANGMLLVELRRNLVPTGASQLRIRQISNELQDCNLVVVQLTEERAELHDPVAYVKVLIQRNDPLDPLLNRGLKFVDSKRDYLDQLVADNQEYLKLLQNVEVNHQQLIDQLNEVRTYIDKNALWIRSADPLSLSDYLPVAHGAIAFCDRSEWQGALNRVKNRMGQRPYETAIATSGLFFLFVFTRRLKKRLRS